MLFTIKKFFNFIFDKYTKINKIAFYINEEYIFDHYSNVMSNLKNNQFDIILDNKFKMPKYNNIISKLEKNGWNVKFLDDVMYLYQYKCLLTHLYLGGETKERGTIFSRCLIIILKFVNVLLRKLKMKLQISVNMIYFQNILADYNIRFMYGADAGKNSFFEYNNNYNELFDMFFCHGPRDAEITKELFNKPVFEMGYPRYDNYFHKLKENSDKNALLTQYRCDKNKKTILWICTMNKYFSTIETYSKTMKSVASQFNVIVRPHPLEIDPQYTRFNSKVLEIVKSDEFILNDNPYQDMTDLYLLSDFVICDYGGSIFGALYMNKRVLLLNNQNVYKDKIVSSSTAMEVRQYLPSINEDETSKIIEYLSDNYLWVELDKKIIDCRKYYFGDLDENSALRVANYLSNMIKTEGIK